MNMGSFSIYLDFLWFFSMRLSNFPHIDHECFFLNILKCNTSILQVNVELIFLMRCETLVKVFYLFLLFFDYSCLIAPTVFLEKTIGFPWKYFCIFVQNLVVHSFSVYFWVLFPFSFFFFMCLFLIHTPCYLNYCSYKIWLIIEQRDLSHNIFLLKSHINYYNSYIFYINFWISFSISIKLLLAFPLELF